MRLTRILKAIGLSALAALFTTGCDKPPFTSCYDYTPTPQGTSVPASVRKQQRKDAIEKGAISPEAADKLDQADDKER